MKSNQVFVVPNSEAERAYLESLICEDFERCHTGTTLEDVKASFSTEDKGLYHDWLAVAVTRAARKSPSFLEAAA
ncbi:MAG: hypothetical protein GEU95_03765 [Rhizobiales bacterium]|nr:hypothetical protein [Hyphomicrobiales bacterium]